MADGRRADALLICKVHVVQQWEKWAFEDAWRNTTLQPQSYQIHWSPVRAPTFCTHASARLSWSALVDSNPPRGFGPISNTTEDGWWEQLIVKRGEKELYIKRCFFLFCRWLMFGFFLIVCWNITLQSNQSFFPPRHTWWWRIFLSDLMAACVLVSILAQQRLMMQLPVDHQCHCILSLLIMPYAATPVATATLACLVFPLSCQQEFKSAVWSIYAVAPYRQTFIVKIYRMAPCVRSPRQMAFIFYTPSFCILIASLQGRSPSICSSEDLGLGVHTHTRKPPRSNGATRSMSSERHWTTQ